MRENTEGVYAGEGGFLRKGTPHEVATQGSVNTRLGVERCVRFALRPRPLPARRHLTLVHKTNVLDLRRRPLAADLRRGRREYAEVTTAYHHVDAACIDFVQDPAATT